MKSLKTIKVKSLPIFVILALQIIVLAQEPQRNATYFSQNIVINPQCADIFISLVKESSFDFAMWASGYDKSVESFKDSVAFMFDSVDERQIVAKLFMDSDSKEFQGTGTICWVEYDFGTKTLIDTIQEVELIFPQNLANRLESCIKECDFSQTISLQKQYEDRNVAIPLNEIIGKSPKDRAYFYSSPNENCKIKDLFLIPQDKVNLLQNHGKFSFVAYKRKNGEVIKLWLKSDRVKVIE